MTLSASTAGYRDRFLAQKNTIPFINILFIFLLLSVVLKESNERSTYLAGAREKLPTEKHANNSWKLILLLLT
jgi:hypothetical protein